MKILFLGLGKTLRRISLFFIPPFLILLLIIAIAIHFGEMRTSTEIFSFSSFVTMISFSGLAFNWCRVSPSFTSEPLLSSIYQIGIDLFLASLNALIATFFVWLKINLTLLSGTLNWALFGLHFIFLVASLAMFAISLIQLVLTIRKIPK